jgi:hypothetical protein
MRAAPAVQVTIPRQGAWLAFVALLGAAAGVTLLGWLAHRLQAPFAAASALAGFIPMAIALWRWAPVDAGTLAWDGRTWRFAGHPGTLHAVIDFDTWMLMRFDAASPPGRAWLALGATRAGGGWHALRNAVYSRGPDTEAE